MLGHEPLHPAGPGAPAALAELPARPQLAPEPLLLGSPGLQPLFPPLSDQLALPLDLGPLVLGHLGQTARRLDLGFGRSCYVGGGGADLGETLGFLALTPLLDGGLLLLAQAEVGLVPGLVAEDAVLREVRALGLDGGDEGRRALVLLAQLQVEDVVLVGPVAGVAWDRSRYNAFILCIQNFLSVYQWMVEIQLYLDIFHRNLCKIIGF